MGVISQPQPTAHADLALYRLIIWTLLPIVSLGVVIFGSVIPLRSVSVVLLVDLCLLLGSLLLASRGARRALDALVTFGVAFTGVGLQVAMLSATGLDLTLRLEALAVILLLCGSLGFLLLSRWMGLVVGGAVLAYHLASAAQLIAWLGDRTLVYAQVTVELSALVGLALLFVLTGYRSRYADARTSADLLDQLAHTDALTGLLNRRALYQQLERHGRPDLRRTTTITIAFIDLDCFKAVNDTAGHLVGDRVLCEVAACLQAQLTGAVVGRWGGDEFLVLLDHPPAASLALLESARQCVEALQLPGIPVTLSVGATQFGPQGEPVAATLARVDALLYEAKHQGRNRVVQDVHPEASGDGRPAARALHP